MTTARDQTWACAPYACTDSFNPDKSQMYSLNIIGCYSLGSLSAGPPPLLASSFTSRQSSCVPGCNSPPSPLPPSPRLLLSNRALTTPILTSSATREALDSVSSTSTFSGIGNGEADLSLFLSFRSCAPFSSGYAEGFHIDVHESLPTHIRVSRRPILSAFEEEGDA